ncbi:MAG TPA: hypothetical protein VFH80_07715 [Solirubrobacteraceae bacterium]|nr:hypothetical protein [Solirubrobacteraceae bacterium]
MGWWLRLTLLGMAACSAASVGTVWFVKAIEYGSAVLLMIAAALLIVATPLLVVWAKLMVGEWQRPDLPPRAAVSRPRQRIVEDELAGVSIWEVGPNSLSTPSPTGAAKTSASSIL